MKTGRKRARILIGGKVQRIGFRDCVKDFAKKHRLYGTVENVNNYDEDVQIICEGRAENIGAFLDELETLKKDREESNLHLLKIKKIVPTYEDYTGIYNDFDVLRGVDEEGERFHEGAQQLMAMRRENIGFKNQTAQNFVHLDKKYGEISKNLVALNKNIQQSNENIAKLIETLIDKSVV